MFEFLKRRKAKKQVTKAEKGEMPHAPEIDQDSPLARNQRLFDKLNRDIETGSLPDMSKPSKAKIAACEKRRLETLVRAQAEYDAEEVHEPWGAVYSLDRIKANQTIPVEIELWVEDVCDRYLHDVVPMLGLGHWGQNVRKRLYEARGYDWYTISEIYPLINFD